MRTEIEALKEIRDRISYFCSRTDGKYDPPWAQEVIGIIDDVLTTPLLQSKTHRSYKMELNKTNKRLIAARRPFSVVEIKDDPRITNVNGKRSSYNIVGGNGSGIAEFGCDEWAARWFCEAANRYADEIYDRRTNNG